MARVVFAQALQRHIACLPMDVPGGRLRDVLDRAFSSNDTLRNYVLDDQSALRKHMMIFVNGSPIRDRRALSDAVPQDGQVYILQALSGG